MSKDCGCNKKNDKDDCSNKKKRNQIWVYKKNCDKIQNIPDNSYLGKIGFAYHLINKDSKESTEYKINYKFSNFTTGEIVYYVFLYKVTKTKFDKKTNTIKKYLECVSQYSYISKVEQYIANNIINAIGNRDYDLVPNNSNEFNEFVIKYILKSCKKGLNKSTNTPSMTVQLTQVGKEYGSQGCDGGCSGGGATVCNSGCGWCTNGKCNSAYFNG
jgi:hypothetical protein